MSATHRSAWTPKSHQPDIEKMFHERMALIKKWVSAWSSSQRWSLVEYLLQHLNDPQLIKIYNLLAPLMPRDPPPPQDFTRVLPRAVSLRIFSYLDPKSLSRAAQVCWYWKYLCDSNVLWRPKCLRRGWFLPQPPLHEHTLSPSSWKTHYLDCVSNLHWTLPTTIADDDLPSLSNDSLSPSPTTHHHHDSLSPSPTTHHHRTLSPSHTSSTAIHCRPWRDPDPHPDDLSRHTIYMTSQQPMEDYPFLRVSLGRMESGQRSLKDGIHHRTTERAQPKKWSSTPQQTCTTRDQTSPPNHTLQTTLNQTQSATLYGRPITTDQTQTINSPATQTTTDHQTSPTQITIQNTTDQTSPTQTTIQTTTDQTSPTQTTTDHQTSPTQNTTDQPQLPQTTRDQTSPTQTTTLHPTLLEKLRVGSPTSQHTQFSAINNKLSRKVIRDNIHAIQQTSPFPKLPAYYTNEMTSPKIPKLVTKETNGTNKKSEGAVGLSQTNSGWSQDHMTCHVTQLPIQPWNIPEYNTT